MGRPYRERRVSSLRELRKLIEGLELDEGIRIKGDMPEFLNGGLIFVTRPTSSYCINLCDQVFDEDLKTYVPGVKDQWLYTSHLEEAWEIIKTRVKQPLEAWLY